MLREISSGGMSLVQHIVDIMWHVVLDCVVEMGLALVVLWKGALVVFWH